MIEQPGTYWHYGIGIGWLGKVIEKLSGQLLNDFMAENVLQPLEMHETSFDISKLGEDRLPNIYAKDEDDRLTDISAFMASPQIEDFAYGGGGILSCPEDYAKFLRMFLNKGKVNGKEFLSEKIIEFFLIKPYKFLMIIYHHSYYYLYFCALFNSKRVFI